MIPGPTLILLQNLGAENVDVSIIGFPGSCRQSRFDTCLFQKGQTIPVVFQGNLGQKDAPIEPLFDVNTVFADFYLLDVFNLLQRREH